MTADLVGRMVLGRYRIVRQLAEGGMGVVYLARAEGAAGFIKPVVLKLILAKHSSNPQFLGMFVREAQILAQLRHPGIVDVIEFGEEDGAYVMVLEYVAGYHLGQWQSYLKLKQRSVPTELAIHILIGVLDALHHVHTQSLPDGTQLNITHRDVSPSNILLGNDGLPRLLDFGVARMEVDTLWKTEGSGFRGKIVYSAPEMFEGGEATPQSDLYACAAVLHEVLLGRNVFVGRSQAETLARVINHVPESVHGVRDDAPDELDEILARALAKRPADRYASAAAFAQALRAAQRAAEPLLRERLAALLRSDFGGEMAQLLGIESLAHRERAWRRFSTPPPALSFQLGAASAAESSIHEQPTRALDVPVVALVDLAAVAPRERAIAPPPPPPPAGVQAAPAEVDAAAPAPAPAPSAPAARSTAKLALAVVALAVIAGAAVAWRFAGTQQPLPERIVVVQNDYRAPEPPAAEPAPAIEAAKAAAEPAVAAPPPAAPPPIEPLPQAAAAAVTAPLAASAPRPLTLRSSTTDVSALTRAFRQKQKQVEACFAAHASDLPGQSAAAIRFEVDAAGRATAAALTPDPLDATALGGCLRTVALATRFPATGKPLSFRIPVTARRVTVGAEP